MGALGYYLEQAGVATTQISLIREHTEAMMPPRALWVPFMLGRPFGVPHDAAFQRRVLIAVLKLLEAQSGPVLADYPEEAPAADDNREGVACPVSFASELDEADLGSVFLREVEELRPWYDLARERRHRTSVGLSGISVTEAAQMVVALLKGQSVTAFRDMTLGETMKVVLEDVRTYYYEAAAARPGTPDAKAIQHWFWSDTAAGRVLLALYRSWSESAEPSLQQLCGTSLVPKAVLVEQTTK